MIVNHFKRQKFKKKIRRKNKRIQSARLRDKENLIEESSPPLNEINTEELKWIERERQAQEEYKIQQLKIFIPVNELKPVQDILIEKVSDTPRLKLPFDLPYHNPFEPEFFDQSKSEICHFFRKTGVCRFDIRCSRMHEMPVISDTILFLNMFTSNTMEIIMAGSDPDLCLEYDENELISEYKDFYADVEKEFSSFGRVMTIRTCRNAMRHLRGNVYVQYRNINDAVYAFSQLNGRYYGGTRLSARFVTIDSWRESICGLYFRGKCPKGGICNFMHVLLNKGESFRDLQQFLNRSTTVLTRRSTKQRKRSRTCSSIDETSTPEPQEQPSDRSVRYSRKFLYRTAKNADKFPANRNRHHRSETRRNRSSSYRRTKEKSDHQSSKRKKSSRHHSRRKEKTNR